MLFDNEMCYVNSLLTYLERRWSCPAAPSLFFNRESPM